MNFQSRPPEPGRQPVFNIPTVMVVLLVLLLGVQALQSWLLNDDQDIWLIANFAFFPAFPEGRLPLGEVLPGARVWSYLTYALLHADWGHVLLNAFWMAAFGSPLAWRFGAWRFLLFSAVAAVAGALVHLATHSGETVALVGASAAVSAHMAGASRFLFITPRGMPRSYWTPAAPLWLMVRDTRTMTFLGVWVAINLAIGIFGSGGLASGPIAWQAHLGGFAVGLLLFRWFDPVPTAKFLREPPPPPAA